jgi:hypothetical protein
VRDDIPAYTTYVPGSLTATSGTVYTATDRIEWVGDLPYTTTYTNTTNDYVWGDSLGRGDVPGVKYDWLEIKDTGLPMSFYAPNMGKCFPVPIPFDFNFYGNTYTQAGVQIDGSLYFPEVGEVGFYPGLTTSRFPTITSISIVSSPCCGTIFINGRGACTIKCWAPHRTAAW